MMLLRPVFGALSPAGPDARLSILIFHRVLPQPDPIFPGEPDAAWFDALMARMKTWFNVLPLDEAAAMLAERRLPARAAVITFDDGYEDNHSVALPILLRHGLCATFFIATGFLDGGRMWNDTVIESVRRCTAHEIDFGAVGLGRFRIGSATDKRNAIEALLGGIKYRPLDERAAAAEQIADLAAVKPPDDLMMKSSQVLEMLRAGMQLGAHTVTHPILSTVDEAYAEAEIGESKRVLEGILGRRVGLFAYPNGRPDTDYQPKDVAIVRRLGFDAAVSTRQAAAGADSDPLQLPRFTPWDRSFPRFGVRLARSLLSG